MRRLGIVAAAAVASMAWLLAARGVTLPLPGAAAQANGSTLVVIEHADTDAVLDLGASGDTAGDVLTFANPVFDAADQRQIGTDQGSCVRTRPGKAWECTWTTILQGGQLAVQGPFYDAADSTLAIIGGTGDYAGASGEMELRARNGGKEYEFTYRIE